MNLNVLTNIMDYFQGNVTNVHENCNKGGFLGLFESAQESLQDIDSELESLIKDSDGDIDYELLQGILGGLDVFNFNNGLTNLNSISKNPEQDTEELIEILNNTSIENNPEQLYEEYVSECDIQKVSDNIFESISDYTIEEIFINDDVLNLNNLDNLQIDYDEDITINNQKNNIIDSVKVEESYNKLEISSLSNKANLFNDTKPELEDDELNVLENTLDDGFNNLSSFNNIVNKINDSQNTVSAETSPIREVRQEVIGDDIVQTVRYLKENGLEEIKVKINPRELGEMTIKIIKSLEETKLSITISNEDIYNLVNKNSSEITKHLKALDINVKEVVVEVKSNDENLFSENFNQEFNKNNQNNEKRKQNKLRNFEIENIEDVSDLEIKDNNLNILI